MGFVVQNTTFLNISIISVNFLTIKIVISNNIITIKISKKYYFIPFNFFIFSGAFLKYKNTSLRNTTNKLIINPIIVI